jgi:hypothetical protein
MAIAGHKSMSVFKRYSTGDRRELQQAIGQPDTYMDTSAKSAGPHISQTIGN